MKKGNRRRRSRKGTPVIAKATSKVEVKVNLYIRRGQTFDALIYRLGAG
jgi:hypothetical protein